MQPTGLTSAQAQLGVAPEQLASRARPIDANAARKIAAEFESVFVSLVLKEMRQTLEPGTLFGGDTADSYGGLFDLFLSQHIARGAGLGIASLVGRQLGEKKTP